MIINCCDYKNNSFLYCRGDKSTVIFFKFLKINFIWTSFTLESLCGSGWSLHQHGEDSVLARLRIGLIERMSQKKLRN